MCPLDYTDDLKFWMIDENFLESCCQDKLIARREAIMGEVAKLNQKEEEEEPEYFGEGRNTFFSSHENRLYHGKPMMLKTMNNSRGQKMRHFEQYGAQY